MEPIKTVCVFGAGFMGWQISLQCASHGVPVYLYDNADIAADPDYFPNGLPACPVDGSSYKLDGGTKRVKDHNH